MKNVIYSTTRQWNCGDEFILAGCINLLNNVIGTHNAIIFNRNPDIRSSHNTDQKYRNFKIPPDDADIYELSTLRFGFHDNSIKYNSDLSYADLAVFAGSPEWLTSKCINFYHHIIKNKLPVLILGVGGYDNPTDIMKEVVSKSLLFTVRDKKLLDIDFMSNAIYEACPALFTVPPGQEKNIQNVNHIGLNYQTDFSHSVRSNCISDEAHSYSVELFNNIINSYKDKKISVICHYIDDLEAAHHIFKDKNVEIVYSYDSKDYINIYKNFDLIISSRVHGAGISSSLGIPNFIIAHDNRFSTTEGFLSNLIEIGEDFKLTKQKIDNVIANINNLNKNLILHKKAAFERYTKLIQNALNKNKIPYDEKYINQVLQQIKD